MRKKITDHLIDAIKESLVETPREPIFIMQGDSILDDTAERANLSGDHPSTRTKKVLDACDRDPRFTKSIVVLDRRYRTFSLKPEHIIQIKNSLQEN